MTSPFSQRRNFLLPAIITFLAIAAALPAFAQDFDTQHTQDVANNPPGVTCVLKSSEGRTQFHMGEIISLEALFSSNGDKRYRLNIDPGNRNILWSGDEIAVDRVGDAPDALFSFYDRSQGYAYSGAGPQWADFGKENPPTRLDINEWRRFDQPGAYRIYLRTTRVQEQVSQREFSSLGPLKTSSNILQIEILPPDPLWSRQMLSHALPAFQSTPKTDESAHAQVDAARIIRFLDTPASQSALINRYHDLTLMDIWNPSIYWSVKLGLLGSRQRTSLIVQMLGKIPDPQFSISSFFVSDLAELQTTAVYPDPLPPRPVNDPDKMAAWQKEVKARTTEREKYLSEDQALLRKALRSKQGSAHAHSAFALFDLATHFGDPPNVAQAKAMMPMITADFVALGFDEQNWLLQNDSWLYLRSRKMIEPLRHVYHEPQGRSDYENRDLRTIALRRLCDLSPKEGRQLILAEIQSPRPQISTDLLISLSDATLPELDRALAANLAADGDTDTNALLIQRYATAAIFPQVKAFYGDKGGKWACAIQSALLAYFLRVAPGFGSDQTEKALASRKDTGCYRMLLGDVSQYRRPNAPWMPAPLQKIALAALNDPDIEVAKDAAKALSAHGSPSAEAPLWAQLRHLQTQGQKSIDNDSRRSVAEALATAPAWLIPTKQFREIQSLFPHNAQGNQFWIQSIDRGDQICLSADIVHDDGQNESWRLSQYMFTTRAGLKRKLAQYPRGTTFTRIAPYNGVDSPATLAAIVDLSKFLAKRGMRLTTSR